MCVDQTSSGRKKARTLGRGKEFEYTGAVESGVTIHYGFGDVPVRSEVFREILGRFRRQTIPGGFSRDSPTPGGLGEWVNTRFPSLTPQHVSRIAAILVKEGFATSYVEKKAVYVVFK